MPIQQLLYEASRGDAPALERMAMLVSGPHGSDLLPALYSNHLLSQLLIHLPSSLPILLKFCECECLQHRLVQDFPVLPQSLLQTCYSASLRAKDAILLVKTMAALANTVANRKLLFETNFLVQTLLDFLLRFPEETELVVECFYLIQTLTGERSEIVLVVPGFLPVWMRILRQPGANLPKLLAMQLMEEICQDDAVSARVVFSAHFSELCVLLRVVVEENAAVMVAGEEFNLREIALMLLAALAIENHTEFLANVHEDGGIIDGGNGGLLEFYARVMEEDLKSGADLFPIVITLSRLCENQANCDRIYAFPRILELMIACARCSACTTEAKGFVLRTLVTLVLSQERRMINSLCFPDIVALFVDTAKRGDTRDIMTNSRIALKTSHCLMSGVFVHQRCYINDDEDLVFWSHLLGVWVMLSANQVGRISTRSAYRRMPTEMTRLVFQMINGGE